MIVGHMSKYWPDL